MTQARKLSKRIPFTIIQTRQLISTMQPKERAEVTADIYLIKLTSMRLASISSFGKRERLAFIATE
jgi:hypothetical protein